MVQLQFERLRRFSQTLARFLDEMKVNHALWVPGFSPAAGEVDRYFVRPNQHRIKRWANTTFWIEVCHVA